MKTQFYLRYLTTDEQGRWPVAIFSRVMEHGLPFDRVLPAAGAWIPTETIQRWTLGFDSSDIEEISEDEALAFLLGSLDEPTARRLLNEVTSSHEPST